MGTGKGTGESVLEVGRTPDGFVVRIAGRGSRHESPGLKAFVMKALDGTPSAAFTVDLSACEYLDSTFLGCLVGLHSKFNAKGGPRVHVAGSDDKLGQLFGSSGLDRVLPRGGSSEPAVGEWLAVPAAELDRDQLGEHLIECHRRLAEVGGPEAETFAAIADQIERELHPARR